ncbi:hypothetical protein RSOLAG22IIIB_06401 [Rhizoctonia solani]|uniref:Uncharacterized protein n=1 Tax=Rhizoctonia solani TaxID=456999 RepID=A0A0K6GEB9_9AGAM|nr:unnamed protein product [Rhizoctonia solani]CUA76938.1 hypothetical protein RSOLAG22IIIB_06401 [Rhizoctonia solani]
MTEASEPEWSLWDAIAPEAQLALNFKTNPANYESHWTTVWHKCLNELLRLKESPTIRSSERLIATSQYSLVQRNKTRSQSISLRSVTIAEAGEETDPEAENDIPQVRSLRIQVQITSDTSELDRRDDERDLPEPAATTQATELSPTLASGSPAGAATTRPPHSEQGPRTPSSSIKQDGTRAEPSSNRTVRVKRGRDSKFWVDIAVIRGKCVGKDVSTILGRKVRPHIALLPGLLEGKCSPPRSRPLMFEDWLVDYMMDAYGDINLKAPVAFLTHQEQKSIIGLACSGLWWSFTVIARTDRTVVWSKVFDCGHASHDLILAQLVEAMVHSPQDPAAYQNNRSHQLLRSHARTRYDVNQFALR